MIDQKNMTEAQLSLVKNASSWAAKTVSFDSIILYNGETPTVTPIVLSKEVDYATHGFPPATEKAFKDLGFRVLRPPTYAGPALYFNYAKMPAIAPKAVRQAIAHAINVDELIQQVLRGRASKMCGPLAPINLDYSAKVQCVKHDVKKFQICSKIDSSFLGSASHMLYSARSL